MVVPNTTAAATVPAGKLRRRRRVAVLRAAVHGAAAAPNTWRLAPSPSPSAPEVRARGIRLRRREIRLSRRGAAELRHVRGAVVVVLGLQVGWVLLLLGVVVGAGHFDGKVLWRGVLLGLARVGARRLVLAARGLGQVLVERVVGVADRVVGREHRVAAVIVVVVERRAHETGRVGRLLLLLLLATESWTERRHLRRELRTGRGRELVLHGRVHRFQPPVLEEGLQLAGVEQLGLLEQPRDHDGRRLLHVLLDERDHGEVAHNLDVLLQIQAVGGRLVAQLARRPRLPRLVALDLVLDAHVDAGGGVGVRLQAPRHVVEDALEADLATAHLAHPRHELDPLADLVPNGKKLVGRGVLGRWDGVVLDDERVQLNDLAVRVQHVDGELARDARGEGRDGGVLRLLAHLVFRVCV